MPALARTSPDNPDFARVLAVRGLPGTAPFAFDIEPDETEAAALARLLDARSVRKMRLRGELRHEAGGVALDATLGASVVQTCVVTLDPVTTRIETPVRRLFLPDAPSGGALDIAPEEDDAIEPLGERIDLGLVAIEALALALPPYPRKEGAALEPQTDGEGAEGDGKPFAALAALRGRLTDDGKP